MALIDHQSANGITPQNGHREAAIRELLAAAELPPDAGIRRFVQRGRERATAELLMELCDGRLVKLGGIDGLWSQTEFGKALSAATGCVPMPVKVGDWRTILAGLFRWATDVEESADETSEAEAGDILALYLRRAPDLERNDAIDQLAPFHEDGRIYIHPQDFANFMRRELGEQTVKRSQARAILRDAGYNAQKVSFNRAGARDKRTSVLYYAGQETGQEGPQNYSAGE